ncbi:DUF11 domain-containing protein [Parasphingopyxis lamellibrachiae]|uniref:Putative repeat protein (TIGR01451 family) n=1 Tax=Parasphingopyxis lamellibrachiae TaxID=680125 RepID=A0A3D9FC03_9SPHN|nr:DUF11 domain-containing protein [Parasphingopyxis lamellibrachiae]RED15345.1 putative repeat protein (TIGR01451 family) [Parasphingopyxis lamellibrachiae]
MSLRRRTHLHSVALRAPLLLAALSPASLASQAQAAGTLAGTPIENTATASYDDGGTTITVDSNTVSLIVDEILDIAVTSADPGDVPVRPGELDSVLKFTVTNGGNGPEPVLLTIDPNIASDDFDPAAVTIFIDTDDNGVYDVGTDTLYTLATPPTLDPDASITVFLLGDIPATTADGERSEVELTGTAATGSGTPGTVFAGQGEGGGDAVVGSTGATANDSGFYAVVDATLDLTKSATVLDPFGGATQVPGSVITYRLTAETTGSGSIDNVVITDAIPGATTYVDESITLDSTGLTDTADADAGTFDGSGIAVTLGTVAGGTTNIIEFQVVID